MSGTRDVWRGHDSFGGVLAPHDAVQALDGLALAVGKVNAGRPLSTVSIP
jgi:hypothetical protein